MVDISEARENPTCPVYIPGLVDLTRIIRPHPDHERIRKTPLYPRDLGDEMDPGNAGLLLAEGDYPGRKYHVRP